MLDIFEISALLKWKISLNQGSLDHPRSTSRRNRVRSNLGCWSCKIEQHAKRLYFQHEQAFWSLDILSFQYFLITLHRNTDKIRRKCASSSLRKIHSTGLYWNSVIQQHCCFASSWLQTFYLINMKNIPRIDKINEAKSHIVKFSFKISKVNKIAQIVLDPDLAATAASGKISENALYNNSNSLLSYQSVPDRDGGLTWRRNWKQWNKIMKSKTLSIYIRVRYKILFLKSFISISFLRI